jgi:chromosomal replication initiation ATPase DnaA
MADAELNVWQRILTEVRAVVPADEYRRWFAPTGYASDSGDQITVWVPSDAARRHIELYYLGTLRRTLSSLGRSEAAIRFVVAGYGDEEDETE